MTTQAGRPPTPPGFVLVSDEDYERLVESASLDDNMIICEVCGAWLYRDEVACASTADFHGCWKAATAGDFSECMSHRAPNKMPGGPRP